MRADTQQTATKADKEISRSGSRGGPVSGSCVLDGGPLGVELPEVEEADEAVARACLGASIARVLYHAAEGRRRPRRWRRRRPFAAAGLRGEGEERGGQEEEHLARRSKVTVSTCENQYVLPLSVAGHRTRLVTCNRTCVPGRGERGQPSTAGCLLY